MAKLQNARLGRGCEGGKAQFKKFRLGRENEHVIIPKFSLVLKTKFPGGASSGFDTHCCFHFCTLSRATPTHTDTHTRTHAHTLTHTA